MKVIRQFSVGTLFFLAITAASTFARADQQQKQCPQTRVYPQYAHVKDGTLEDMKIFMDDVGTGLIAQMSEPNAKPFFRKFSSMDGCDPISETLSELSVNYRGRLAKELAETAAETAPTVLPQSHNIGYSYTPNELRCFKKSFGKWLNKFPYERSLKKCLTEVEE